MNNNDLSLLRWYEPIMKFTEGEMFYPCAVDEFVRHSSLWIRPPNRGSRPVIRELDLQKLIFHSVENPIPPKHSLFLRLVEEPLDSIKYRQWRSRKDRPRFRAPGRLARVGLLARLTDAFFDVALLLRGRVPGGTAAAAEIKYRDMFRADPRYVYYGRVLREGGYIVLHYLFFYAMNNWRSTFYGVNDHEGDWEQIFVYLVDNGDEAPEPAWVAYASHDFSGDDLRRRWDDPEFVREGSHPVIYTGAGSHASYFQAGEYLAHVELEFMKPVFTLAHIAQRVWSEVLRQGNRSDVIERVEQFFRVPFVDYARGDGFTIGPDQRGEWSPVLMGSETPWVVHYRGLWGLDTKDPLRGETAPAGPKYNRDGTVRQSWYDPLGWAGLRKVTPFPSAEETLKHQISDLRVELAAVEDEIERLNKELPELGIEVRALQSFNHLRELHTKRAKKLADWEDELNAFYARRTELNETLRACQIYLQQIHAQGLWDDNPQAHIQHKHLPQSVEEVQSSTIASIWAALSSGLLLISTITLFVVRPPHWVEGLGVVMVLFVAVEAILRRNFQRLLLRTTILLAMISVAVLVYEFYVELIFLMVVGLALMIIVDNIRELRGH